MSSIRILQTVGGVVAAVFAIAFGLVLLLVISDDDGGGGGGAELTAGSLKVGKNGVPAAYAGLIQKAADDCKAGLPAGVLAAQLQQESGFQADPGVSEAGALGIAQFMPGTWYGKDGHKGAGVDGNKDGRKDPLDPEDAIPAQGRMMCKLLATAKKHPEYSGSPIELALAGYNAGWGRVEQYRGVPPASFAKGQTYNYVKIIMGNVARLTGPDGKLSTSGWTRPADGPLGTPYHQRGGSWSSGMHTGIDFTVPTGTPVKAAGPGTVQTAGKGGAYGNQVVIRHQDGTYSQYAHLSRISVSAGQHVKGGRKIGLSGATGNVTGPHLHFEIRTGPEYGSDIDPAAFLRKHGVKL
ncbi:peptidoglycan DD-metalloendopeptidase family protein [Streptomyces oryzae]|uniref:peptidoglycan DD-metalloendopeptidase family protein n=1 Tax=Streptomyces oryzae TaxID=1434886 RepID=UPI001FFDED21|nr:peptidoglycan DD-metalloendopeptidase family protein [Streptomyces oryzae]